ncbi:hypothetical protein HanRHA438_Chr13g0599921 [Helianthus annuus]|nr:hypothetical protein HanRHA438_Chr13g0599921 [Helianthus annuus]
MIRRDLYQCKCYFGLNEYNEDHRQIASTHRGSLYVSNIHKDTSTHEQRK